MQVVNNGFESVALSKLRTHPRNPRRGNLEKLGESIAENGFYGAVVAQKTTGYILAGNHRFLAAQAAGADEIPVIWVDVDNDRALRILLADNKTSDKATYHDEALAALLAELNQTDQQLVGTSFESEEL